MPHRLPPGCIEDVDRHGNIRIYFRRKGAPKVRLREMPWTPAFMTEYEAAKGQATTPAAKGINPGTWRWLCVKFFAESTEYKSLSPHTQSAHRWALEGTYDEPIAPGSARYFRDMPLSKMNVDAIEVLRDRKKMATPEGANARVKAIRAVFKWALAKKHVAANPAKDVPYVKNVSEGYHSWTEDQVQQYENHHPIGTKARLALAIGLYTGMRRGDAIRLGRQHVKDGEITFTVGKGRSKKVKRLTIPMLPELQAIIDASPCCGDMTFLVSELGKAFTDISFSNKFRQWCNQAGLPHCSFHGLRKAAATRLSNLEATTPQLMAVFGWDSMRTAEIYTRASNQQRLAASAMSLLKTRTKNVPPSVPPGEKVSKIPS